MRVFLGVPVTPDIRNKASEIIKEFKIKLPECRWTKLENLHITLKFYGEISDEELNNIKLKINNITPGIKRGKLILTQLSRFDRRDRVVFIVDVIQENNWLTEFLLNLEKNEKIDYTAHLTLGRLKIKPAIRMKIAKFLKYYETKKDYFLNDRINNPEIVLYKSTLTQDGPIYEVLTKW
ncbi:MAG: RNA 2',3'-cyclic phosphodiesterase [Candidatus Hydrogenedentota bacterium]